MANQGISTIVCNFCLNLSKVSSLKSYILPILIPGVVVGVGAATCISYLETVPYSKRTRLIFTSRRQEKRWGETAVKWIEYCQKILPKTHPWSFGVRMITNKVTEAMETGLRDDKVWGVGPINALHVVKGVLFGQQLVNDSRVAHYLGHMKNLEVFVVDNPVINSYCYSGGKIVVNTGLLRLCEYDDEVAAIVAHEVGHALARHIPEREERCDWLSITQMWLYSFDKDVAKKKAYDHPSAKSLAKKTEFEADYIGMMLMASAGYDPRAVLKILSRVHVTIQSTYMDPFQKKRFELIAQAQQEAITLYMESRHKC